MLFIRIPCPSITNPNFGEIFSPGLVVQVRLANGDYQPFEFILDSGADCTLVPRYMANLVGYQLPASPNASVSGISGHPMPAYTGEMSLRIQTEDFAVRCLFTQSNRTALLLGRLDFFSLFNVQFDGQGHYIILDRVS